MRSMILIALCLLASVVHAAAPPRAASPAVLKLIEQLGDDSSDVRKDAEKKLTALGEDVVPALRKASKQHADIDVRLRTMTIAAAIEKTLFGEVRVYKGHTDGVIVFALSPDGKKMASGSWKNYSEGVVRVW